jgi:hypothetical protein
MARIESPPGWAPHAEQLKAVVLSAMRSHEITVVDLSRSLGVAAWEALRRSELAVVVVRDDIRGIAAGREVVREFGEECERLGLVVRHVWSRIRPSFWPRSEAIRRADLVAAHCLGSVASCWTLFRSEIRPKRRRW